MNSMKGKLMNQFEMWMSLGVQWILDTPSPFFMQVKGYRALNLQSY